MGIQDKSKLEVWPVGILKLRHLKVFPINLCREAFHMQCFPPTRNVSGHGDGIQEHDVWRPLVVLCITTWNLNKTQKWYIMHVALLLSGQFFSAWCVTHFMKKKLAWDLNWCLEDWSDNSIVVAFGLDFCSITKMKLKILEHGSLSFCALSAGFLSTAVCKQLPKVNVEAGFYCTNVGSGGGVQTNPLKLYTIIILINCSY